MINHESDFTSSLENSIVKHEYSITRLNRNLLDEPLDISSPEFFFSLSLLFFKPKLSIN